VAAALRQTAFQLGVAVAVAAVLSIAATRTSSLLTAVHPLAEAAALRSGYQLALILCGALAAIGGLVTLVALNRRQVSPSPAPTESATER
jgi:hypothetical protein